METADLVPRLPRKIQEDIASFRTNLDARLERLEEISRKPRRDSAGVLVTTRATAGDFNVRASEVDALERAGS
jgi:hypothetical protein